MFSARHSAFRRASAGRAVSAICRACSAGFTPPFLNCHCVPNSVISLMNLNTSVMSKSVRAREPRNGGTGTSGAFGSEGERRGRTLPFLLGSLTPICSPFDPFTLAASNGRMGLRCRLAWPSTIFFIAGLTLPTFLSAASLSITRSPSNASSP